MSWTTETGQNLTGAEVFGADGDKVGTVAAVYPGYIVVEKGFFFPTDYYIPMSAVASYDNDQVYLNLAKDAALNSGWDAQPTDLETASYDTSMSSGGDWRGMSTTHCGAAVERTKRSASRSWRKS